MKKIAVCSIDFVYQQDGLLKTQIKVSKLITLFMDKIAVCSIDFAYQAKMNAFLKMAC